VGKEHTENLSQHSHKLSKEFRVGGGGKRRATLDIHMGAKKTWVVGRGKKQSG